MFRLGLCLAALAILACGLRAEEKPPMPKVPALSQGSARLDGENLRCMVTTTRLVTEYRAETVIQGGMAVTQKVAVQVPVSVMEVRLIPVKGVEAYTTGGNTADPTKLLQRLEPSKLTELLKKDTRVFFAQGSGKVDPAYVKELREGNIILVLPTPKPEPKPSVPPAKSK